MVGLGKNIECRWRALAVQVEWSCVGSSSSGILVMTNQRVVIWASWLTGRGMRNFIMMLHITGTMHDPRRAGYMLAITLRSMLQATLGCLRFLRTTDTAKDNGRMISSIRSTPNSSCRAQANQRSMCSIIHLPNFFLAIVSSLLA